MTEQGLTVAEVMRKLSRQPPGARVVCLEANDPEKDGVFVHSIEQDVLTFNGQNELVVILSSEIPDPPGAG